jgi:hypothetical protein
MNILLYVSIAWVTLCVLFVGLDLIVLLIVEHASNASQAMGADDSISDQARQIAKLELAMDETVRRQARELADTSDALGELEDRVTLAPRDAILTADGAVAPRTQRTGAVIIRDPRLTRARTSGDQSGIGINATFLVPTACGGRDTAAKTGPGKLGAKAWPHSG